MQQFGYFNNMVIYRVTDYSELNSTALLFEATSKCNKDHTNC